MLFFPTSMPWTSPPHKILVRGRYIRPKITPRTLPFLLGWWSRTRTRKRRTRRTRGADAGAERRTKEQKGGQITDRGGIRTDALLGECQIWHDNPWKGGGGNFRCWRAAEQRVTGGQKEIYVMMKTFCSTMFYHVPDTIWMIFNPSLIQCAVIARRRDYRAETTWESLKGALKGQAGEKILL